MHDAQVQVACAYDHWGSQVWKICGANGSPTAKGPELYHRVIFAENNADHTLKNSGKRPIF